MAQWTNVDEANGAPKFTVDSITGRTGIQEYGNTVFGYTPEEVTSDDVGLSSPGWVRIVKGEGIVTGLTIVSGGTGYANTDTVDVDGTSGTIETDANGTIVAIDFTPPTSLIDQIPDITIDTESGVGATITVNVDGRVGRVTSETLVAMRNIEE